jgi:hypothetical protein
MKLKYAPLLVMLFMLPVVCLGGTIEKIAGLIKQGNVHELANFFAANVDISIIDESDVYSKTQAEIILKKFFTTNKPSSVKILHRVNSNPNYNFAVLIVTTDKGVYRVALTMKGAGEALSIIEFRIEAEKT